MARARDDQAKRLADIHRDREQLISERRKLHASFVSMIAERRAIIHDVRATADQSRARHTPRRPG